MLLQWSMRGIFLKPQISMGDKNDTSLVWHLTKLFFSPNRIIIMYDRKLQSFVCLMQDLKKVTCVCFIRLVD
jgi:hypothetical protein